MGQALSIMSIEDGMRLVCYRGGTGAGCNTFCLIDHITFVTQERQPKLISFERVIFQVIFYLALKFNTLVAL